METPSAPAAPALPVIAVKVPQFNRQFWGWAALGALLAYLGFLFILALDQQWHWHLFPTQSDREITALVEQLGDTTLTPEQKLAVMDKIVNWNSFAVPILIKATTQTPAPESDGAVQCLQQISLKYYGNDIAQLGTDSEKLNQWWTAQQAEWARQQAAKK